MTKKEQPFQLINAEVLGIKKPIIVFESNRNQIAAMKTQLALMQLDSLGDKEPQEILEAYTGAIETEAQFLKSILKLTEKQVDAIYDLTQEETVELTMQVIMKIMHIQPQATDVEEEVDAEEEEQTLDTE